MDNHRFYSRLTQEDFEGVYSHMIYPKILRRLRDPFGLLSRYVVKDWFVHLMTYVRVDGGNYVLVSLSHSYNGHIIKDEFMSKVKEFTEFFENEVKVVQGEYTWNVPDDFEVCNERMNPCVEIIKTHKAENNIMKKNIISIDLDLLEYGHNLEDLQNAQVPTPCTLTDAVEKYRVNVVHYNTEEVFFLDTKQEAERFIKENLYKEETFEDGIYEVKFKSQIICVYICNGSWGHDKKDVSRSIDEIQNPRKIADL